MAAKYDGLKSLLTADKEAYDFFATLPQYVREHIASHDSGVNSFDSLKSYADNLTQGDI